MKVVHVVPHVDDEASGPSYSVPRLCQGLAARDHAVALYCLAASTAPPGVRVETFRQWRLLRRFAISPGLARALAQAARTADVVHNHSLWSMSNVAAGWAVPGRRAKLVTSPRGTLSPWALARNRQVKRLVWPLQRRALQRADLLHATSEDEYRDIRARGLRAPVAVIPNGVDLPDRPATANRSSVRTLLFLGRIHPVKGIDRLLAAWRALQADHADWQLVIAGKGEPDHERAARELAHTLQIERVSFAGPLYGGAKSDAYFAAELFVLPSHSENFGMTVAEALAHGCPVIVSDRTPWSGVVSAGCGWNTAIDVDALAAVLRQAMALPAAALAAMGEKGRDFVAAGYGWDAISREMESAYRWLLGEGAQPACMQVD